jgi:hypothetical protein
MSHAFFRALRARLSPHPSCFIDVDIESKNADPWAGANADHAAGHRSQAKLDRPDCRIPAAPTLGNVTFLCSQVEEVVFEFGRQIPQKHDASPRLQLPVFRFSVPFEALLPIS